MFVCFRLLRAAERREEDASRVSPGDAMPHAVLRESVSACATHVRTGRPPSPSETAGECGRRRSRWQSSSLLPRPSSLCGVSRAARRLVSLGSSPRTLSVLPAHSIQHDGATVRRCAAARRDECQGAALARRDSTFAATWRGSCTRRRAGPSPSTTTSTTRSLRANSDMKHGPMPQHATCDTQPTTVRVSRT